MTKTAAEKALDLFPDELTRGNVKKAMEKSAQGSAEVWKVKRSDILVRPGFNPRVENDSYKAHIRYLADSIKANGFYVHKPVAVSIAIVDGVNKIYEADGHTRLLAYDLAVSEGLEISEFIPCVAESREVSEVDRTVALHTSNSGKPFTPYELGLVCQRLVRLGDSEAKVAERLNITPKYVGDLVCLIAAPSNVKKLVMAEQVSASLAVEMLKLHGDKAGEVLLATLDTANKTGKTKVTQKDMPGYAATKYIKKAAPRAFEVMKSIAAHEGYQKLPDEIRALVDELLNGIPAPQEAAA